MPADPIVHAEPVAVKRETAARMLDCGITMVWKLQKAGELVSVKVGSDDRITVDSIRQFVRRQIATAKK